MCWLCCYRFDVNSYINGIKNEEKSEKSAMEIKKMIATEGWKGSREFNLYPGTAKLCFSFSGTWSFFSGSSYSMQATELTKIPKCFNCVSKAIQFLRVSDFLPLSCVSSCNCGCSLGLFYLAHKTLMNAAYIFLPFLFTWLAFLMINLPAFLLPALVQIFGWFAAIALLGT